MKARTRRAGSAPASTEAEELVLACEPYRPQLVGLATRALQDPAGAEDVVQETYLKLWRTSERYDPDRASPRTWVFAIARNAVLDALRRRGARPETAIGVGPHSPEEVAVSTADGVAGHPTARTDAVMVSPIAYAHQAWQDDPFDRLLTGLGIEEGMRRLTTEHRQVIVEVHLRGRTCADLAQELRLPASTVRSRLVYAVRSLRLTLEEGGWLQ